MHVFSAIQSFNRTCRKLELVTWMCVEKIAENQNYNIFEAGPEMSRAPAPLADAPESDTLYADQALVAHQVVGGSVAETETAPGRGARRTARSVTCHVPHAGRGQSRYGSRSARARAPAGGRPAARQPRCNGPRPTSASHHNRSRSCAVSRQAATGSICLTLQDDARLARPAGGGQVLGSEDVQLNTTRIKYKHEQYQKTMGRTPLQDGGRV